MYVTTSGVILKKRNFNEADRLLTIFTKDFGKITAIAKGVKRPKSKKAGHLELGNWCKIMVAKGKNLDLIAEVQLKKAFGIENFTEEKANRIYHVLELIDSLLAPSQKNLQIYNLLVNYLNRISKGEDFNAISAIFKIKLLNYLGFFSAKSLKDSKSKMLIIALEEGTFESITRTNSINENSYLKLSAFCDSIIEKVTESNIKTTRFLNG